MSVVVRDRYPPGVPCWVDTGQPDPDAAAAFYGGLFGWRFAGRMAPGSAARYLVARLHGHDVAGIGSAPGGAPATPTWETYVSVVSVDETAARMREAGGTVPAAPFDVLDDGRTAVCADPAGAAFRLWEPRAFTGAQVVNAAGTWNWSTLATPDVPGAIAFYGAVFGWEATPMDFGQGETVLVRRPGYGEFLERFEPGIRERHASAGPGTGFSDAVAWITATREDEPARWEVTFAVDDADAAATRAKELGGAVVQPPTTIEPTRFAVLRDPQGAVLTVSRYQPG